MSKESCQIVTKIMSSNGTSNGLTQTFTREQNVVGMTFGVAVSTGFAELYWNDPKKLNPIVVSAITPYRVTAIIKNGDSIPFVGTFLLAPIGVTKVSALIHSIQTVGHV